MKEEYLHYVWKNKKLKSEYVHLTNGSTAKIIDVGWHNLESGPDFFSGSVKIDGVLWTGNIELHLKSSDWYAHGHQHDKAYDNVILHVVYEHNKTVFIDGRELPTLELKEVIHDLTIDSNDYFFNDNGKPFCLNSVQGEPAVIQDQLNEALFQRIHRNSESVLAQLHENWHDRREALFQCLLQAFGTSVNKLPFQELAQRLSWYVLQKESWDSQRVEALLFGVAGFLEEDTSDNYYNELKMNWLLLKNKYRISSMNVSSWKFGGVRPHNFPTVRLAQLAQIIGHWKFDFGTINSASECFQTFHTSIHFEYEGFWSSHYHFGKESKKHHSLALSISFRNHLVINGLIPYLMYLHKLENRMEYMDIALELLELLPSEKNRYTTLWKSWGVSSINASNSQAMIEQYKTFCLERNCLNCKIGQKAMDKA